MAGRLPPFGSLHLARCAVANEFPHHSQRVRKLNPQQTIEAATLIAAVYERKEKLRRLALEMAADEITLKQTIGFDQAIEVPGVGVLYWTSSKSSSKSQQGRINWLKLCHDKGINESELKRYRKETDGQRRFFLRRRVRGPSGIVNMKENRQEDVTFDEDF